MRRVPYIPQMEVAECGAACLAMITEFLGGYVPLARARNLCGVSRDGVTALGIVKGGRALGLESKAGKADIPALRNVRLPAIIHWELNHFVVLERLTRRHAVLVDPAQGRRTVSLEELDAKFSGIVLMFQAGESFEPGARNRETVSRFIGVLKDAKAPVSLVLGTAILLEFLAVLFPAATQIMIDHIIRPARDQWLWVVLAGVVVVSAAQILLTWLRDRTVQTLNFALDLSLMTRFADHLMHLPIAFLEQRSTGDLMQRIGANETLRALSTRLITAMLDGFLVLGFGALMLAYDPQLGAIVIVLSLGRVLLVRALSTHVQQSSAAELAMRGRESSSLVEAFAAPEVVKAFGAEELMTTRYTDRLVRRVTASMGLRRLSEGVGQLSGVVDGMSEGLILFMGGSAVMRGDLTIGGFMGFLTLQGLLRAPLESVVSAWSDLVYARGIMARIDDVLETPRELEGGEDPGRLSGDIELEDVTFRYGPAGTPICEGLSVRIHAGEKVALVGPSGAGKSTLARLMLGILRPTGGRVTIGGRDLRTLDKARLLRQFGVVLQEPFFFNDTVRANLELVDGDVSDDDLRWAAEVACVDDVIDALPDGFDTPLGENGSRLSGGQRQRLALARALVGRPSVLLLDEATSSLDAETEARLHENLGRIGCTRLLIAHRLATVMDADRILVFHGGQIVQEGTFEQLKDQPGLFAAMLHSLSPR